MRIAIDNIIFQFQKNRPRGISRIWSNILPYLRDMLKDKHEIFLLHRENSLKESFGLREYPIPEYTFRSREEDSRMLSSICMKLKIDLFISTYQTRVEGIKSLVMVHDMIPEIKSWLPKIVEAVSRKESYLSADILVCVSENTKKDIHKWYDVNSKYVETVYPGVSESFHSRTSEEIGFFRDRYKIDFDYVVLDGDITYELSEIFCGALSNLGMNLGIVCYGGVLEDLLPDICRKYDIPIRKICWLQQGEVPVVLSGSKGLVFISSYEGFGLPVLEAMSCKTPVICSPVASLPEVGGDSVMYFNSNTLWDMENKLSCFLKTNDSLVEKAFARSKFFTWKKMSEKITNIIETQTKGI